MRPSHLSLLAAVIAILLGGCSVVTDPESAPPPTTEPGTTQTADNEETAAGGAQQGTLGDIPDLVADVQPSIVSINVTVQRGGRTGLGAGSGVIWSENGVIVTNNHVVAEAEDIEVVLANGERFVGEVIATDPRTDLAAIRIDASGLPAADFAERLPEVGELAVALGNPLGFQNSATAGIVSGLDRTLPVQAGGGALVGLLQTDAPISSGNSGGALVDSDRQVIGINVAALGGPSQAQGRATAENVGFAIPSTTVIPVIEQLLEDGDVSHPFIGIRGATLTAQIAERFGIDRDAGVVVAEVVPGGPAEQAGIGRGDLIVAIAGEEIRSFGDLASIIRDHEVGETLTVQVVRDGDEQTVDVTLAELPDQ
ncbi:MAG: trypsin-like peptidase domain-containing protein [Nitriliruptorales bacterium]|nr:trypsin-like peptidase domain-containing protein [Nitriliruptorales bacterium]